MSKILVTHVGSLPRTQQTVDFLFARERGEEFNQSEFDNQMSAAVADAVSRQASIGVDIVSDGEMSKISYATYVKDRYTGFAGDSERNPPADLKMYPGFLKKLASSGGTPQYARPQCVGEIKSISNDDLNKDILNMQNAMVENSIFRGFMNAASPGVISLFLPNSYYKSRQDYLQAIAEAMRNEYKTIAEAGLDIQLDCPDLALSRHMLFADLSDEEFISIAEQNIEALNYALEDVPAEQVRVHICWGNYEGPHCCDISMAKVFEPLMKTKSRYVLFEASNPRHAHEWEVFQELKDSIPDEKVLVPGVIDTTTNFIEHPSLVAQRIRNFVNIVGRERVVAGTDCGFGTFAGFGAVEAEIAYAKLETLVAGAALV